jgi:sugar lactone lactonase YvrE
LDFGFTVSEDDPQSEIQNPKSKMALIPAALVLLLVALGVALWRITSAGEGQAGQAAMLQAIIPLLIAGGMLFGILTLGQQLGARVTLALCGLTIFALLSAYTIRSTWLLVYDHPDTPNELLIYVQSTPDLPLIVDEIRTLAINQTRNSRSAADPVGGLTMPVIMDSGDAQSGEGSLAWPFQWYLRDFQRIESRNADFFRDATADSFQVAADTSQPEGEKQFAPVVLVSTPHVTEATRQALEENYVARYNSKLNWWFPEGDLTGCDPRVPGYKRFYYSTATLDRAKEDKQCQNLAIDSLPYSGPLAPLLWPFQVENFATIKNYLLYRQLPDPLRLDGREMQVWVRKDLAASGNAQAAETTGGAVKLVAQEVIASGPGAAPGQLDQPRGAAIDDQGNLYVADMANNRIQVFGPDGRSLRTIGSAGSGEGQFQEPRGIAVDRQGNLYVADTWNARVQKFDSSGKFLKSWGSGNDIGNGRFALPTDGTEAGNAAAPLGFYGPRAIAVDERGSVYIADTGNKRIVVTDSEGTFLYQWGHAGNEPGAFNEPIGVAVDPQGNVYVADTWNGRVQVFARGQDGKVGAAPQITWRVAGWQPNTYDDPYLAAGPNGQVYASVPGRNLVLAANLSGDIQLRWGGKGEDTASLTLPSGIAVGQDGTVYVVDRGNNRVLRFKMPVFGR